MSENCSIFRYNNCGLRFCLSSSSVFVVLDFAAAQLTDFCHFVKLDLVEPALENKIVKKITFC